MQGHHQPNRKKADPLLPRSAVNCSGCAPRYGCRQGLLRNYRERPEPVIVQQMFVQTARRDASATRWQLYFGQSPKSSTTLQAG